MKYRKKPVVIEAFKWEDNPTELMEWIQEIGAKDPGIRMGDGGRSCIIPTLEGDHTCSLYDYIICGVKGEFYPCKPDIFEMTYDPAE
jgi:hypothetical protein